MNKYNKIYHGDCLVESDKIESGSVDLILTDLPYGIAKTLGKGVEKYNRINNSEWDEVIEPKKIYDIANRILRKNGKMVLFAQQPFTTQLIHEVIPNLPHCYNMYWDKLHFANCLSVNKAPVSYIEDILIFSKTHYKHDFEGMHPLRSYFKKVMEFIGLNIKQINTKLGHRRAEHTFYIDSTQYGLCTELTYNELIEMFKIDKMQGFKEFTEIKNIDIQYRNNLIKQMNERYPSTFNLWEGKKYKSNILKYKKDYEGLHPTQKPVLLLEDLIKTFSNENDLIVDLTCGSGSTLCACINTNRQYIGIEKNLQYYNISVNRVSGYIHLSKLSEEKVTSQINIDK